MRPNEVTALIGPSGCGKSTFLRTLNRMHELVPGAALAGEILLDGVDIYRGQLPVTEIRRRVGMVFQKPNPFPAMSIAENVVAGLKLWRHQGRQGTADNWSRLPAPRRPVERGQEPARRPGAGASGGQQQRLCIARCPRGASPRCC